MKTIDKKELYENLGNFLRAKGIELKDGSYAQGIEKACSFLTDAINLGQMGLERAKQGLDRNVDRVRQVIHEKTAPKTPPTHTAAPAGSASAASAATASSSEATSPRAKASRAKPSRAPVKKSKGRKSRRGQ